MCSRAIVAVRCPIDRDGGSGNANGKIRAGICVAERRRALVMGVQKKQGENVSSAGSVEMNEAKEFVHMYGSCAWTALRFDPWHSRPGLPADCRCSLPGRYQVRHQCTGACHGRLGV